MFIPCDENDNPLEEPFKLEYSDELCIYCSLEKKGCYGTDGGYMGGCEGSRCEETLEDYHVFYQEAKERVLFKGFSIIKEGENTILKHNDTNVWLNWTKRCIEDLVRISP